MRFKPGEPFPLESVPRPGPGRLPNTVPVRDVIDGIDLRNIGWRPKSLFLSAEGEQATFASFDYDTARGEVASATQLSGEITVELAGLHKGGQYWRRFSLTPFVQVEVSCWNWDRVRLRACSSTLSYFSLMGVFSDQPIGTSRRNNAHYSQLFTNPFAAPTPGVGFTPPGARSAVVATADPGFRWQGYDCNGNRVEVPFPLLAGQRFKVQAASFATTISLQRFIWEIEL